ncbi:MAG: GIN domain-containing protein [Flavobacteriales bacterium]
MYFKPIFFTFITLFLCIGCNKTIEGNGNVIEKSFDLNNFNQIFAKGDFKIILQQNPTSQIKFEMDENLIENIDFSISGESLTIKEIGSVSKKILYNIYVYTPVLKKMELEQNVSLSTKEPFKADEMFLKTNQSSTVNASFDTKDFTLKAYNQSETTLYGETHTFDISAQDEVEINAFNFEAKEVDMDVLGTSELKLFVTKELSGSATDNATVEYREGNFTRDFRTKDQAEVIAIKEISEKNRMETEDIITNEE